MHNFQCIKSAKLADGILTGSGFALADYQSLDDQEIVYEIPTADLDFFIFLFGLRGVGNHYLIEWNFSRNRIVLIRIRDGIHVYLQHAYINLKKQPSFSIRWSRSSIRLFAGSVCFINVLAEDLVEGRWGFAGRSQPMRLPEVTIKVNPAPLYQWIILGDGYSNNRWNNRDFYSWPELAFGDKCPYLNACVAAGNTRRVLEIAHRIGTEFADSKVILAVGADDFMEGETLADTISRISAIATLARCHGASELHVCSILPKPKHHGEVTAWNNAIVELTPLHFDSCIDFHKIIASAADELLVHEDYPGAEAQRAMAAAVLSHFHLPAHLAPLEYPCPRPMLNGLPARIAIRLGGAIDQSLGRF